MAFSFIYGSDDYLVGKAATEAWAKLSEGCDSEWGIEIIDARAQKVDEAIAVINRFRSSAQTVGLFGGARAVWLKNVSFLAATITGQAEGTTTALDELKPLLTAADGKDLRLLISATPVDKRLSFNKWAIANAQAKEIASLEGLDETTLARLARDKGLTFPDEVATIFLKKVGFWARAVDAELEKLSLYYNATSAAPAVVEETVVGELTSTQAEGEFFEPLEAFYSRKTSWALASLRDYFADPANDARPILTAFLNRNRLILMVKTALDAGLAKAGFKGLSWTPKSDELRAQMGAEKTPFNLFAQNPWYLGRLAQEAARFSLAELVAIQRDLPTLFEDIHRAPQSSCMERFFLTHLAAPVKA